MDSQNHSQLPPLWRDRAFLGMSITQFLGAFNDNLFKQLVLLFCLDVSLAGAPDRQPLAAALFALPFVLFSGFAGFLADRNSKRSIVVLCKVAEIVVMALGMLVLLMTNLLPSGPLNMLLVILCLMGMQSAFFGPSKYGILPELFRPSDLPRANAFIQMTTFLAIIFGTALAGYGKQKAGDQLWLVGAACVGIALVGTLTSLLVRKTPTAQPDLEFRPSALAINRYTAHMLWNDKLLLAALLISSLFWFIGGAVLPLVNILGKDIMHLGDGRTSIMAACMGAGIAVGCILAGKLSHNRINFGLVRLGSWGIVIFLCLTPCFSLDISAPPAEAEAAEMADEALMTMMIPGSFKEAGARLSLLLVGLFAGFFAVPLQTFMQTEPPADQKGQMIGAMNLINWIGILLSAAFLAIAQQLLTGWELSYRWIFPILAVQLIPVALFFRPANIELNNTSQESDSATEPTSMETEKPSDNSNLDNTTQGLSK